MLANSEDPAQASVASDLGQHCLFALCQKRDARLIRVNVIVCAFVYYYKYNNNNNNNNNNVFI